MREFFHILFAALLSAVLGAGFGWLIGRLAPEFVDLLAGLRPLKSPESVATALGAICGLGLGFAAMSVVLLAAALRDCALTRSSRQ